jgi:CO/xanthine dehydrogenase FAD-binding subunit
VTTQAYFLPQSLNEATGLLEEHGPSLLVMAGGTIAMPLINEGISIPEKVMGLRRAGLNYLSKPNGYHAIGATTTLTQMLAQEEIPLLKTAASSVGGWSIRNMGTVGGNLFAPPPSGDFAVALLALDASVKLISHRDERIISLSDFYTGFLTTALEPGELVAEVRVPTFEGSASYLKYGRRHANTPAVVTVVANLLLDGKKVTKARLALNAAGPHPFRAKQAESILLGSILDETAIEEAANAAMDESEPFTDAVASDWYRRKMVGVYVKRALGQILDTEEK